MPELSVAVKILHLGIDNIGGIDGFTGLESLVQHPTCFQITYFDTIKRLALYPV